MNLKLAIVGVGVTSRYGIGTNSFLKGISIDEVKKSVFIFTDLPRFQIYRWYMVVANYPSYDVK